MKATRNVRLANSDEVIISRRVRVDFRYFLIRALNILLS